MQLLSISRSVIYEQIRSGRLRTVHQGGPFTVGPEVARYPRPVTTVATPELLRGVNRRIQR